MIIVGIYENNLKRKSEIRNSISRYSIVNDLSFQLYWLESGSCSDPEVRSMQIAFLSLDLPDGQAMGERIYRLNPNCRICYYKSEACDLEPLLSVRPISFYNWTAGPCGEVSCGGKPSIQYSYNEEFIAKLDAIMEDLYNSQELFIYNTRKAKHLIPVDHLLYFRSNLKYVEVYEQKGLSCTLYAKLSDVEEKLCEEKLDRHFLRVHNRFLVNVGQIRLLDKVNHTIRLSDGTEIPISDAQYNATTKRLSAMQKEKYSQIRQAVLK